MKVHLCCGDVYLEGYTNVDVFGDLVGEVTYNPNITTIDKYYKKNLHDYSRPVLDLRMNLVEEWLFATNSVDEFLMVCAIEHLTEFHAKQVIERVYQSLKPNGVFRFDFPDIYKTLEVYKDNPEYAMRLVYGSGKNEWGFHRWGYTKESIKTILNKHQWGNITFCDIVPHEYPMIGVIATK